MGESWATTPEARRRYRRCRQAPKVGTQPCMGCYARAMSEGRPRSARSSQPRLTSPECDSNIARATNHGRKRRHPTRTDLICRVTSRLPGSPIREGATLSDMRGRQNVPGVDLRLRSFFWGLPSSWPDPRLSVDGLAETKVRWGRRFVPLSPGKHTLSCGIGYRWRRDSIEVVIPVDGVLSVRWRGPWLTGLSGKWRVLD